MLLSLVLATLALVARPSTAAAKFKLTDHITLCSRSDLHPDDCIKAATKILLPIMAKGIKEYQMIPLDPMRVPFMELNQSDKPVGLKLNISDSTHVGLRDAEIVTVKAEPEKKELQMDFKIPKYEITGTCDVGGRILLLPITGHGFCNLTAYDFDLSIKIHYKAEPKNNKNHLHFEKFIVKLKLKKGAFKIEGLFGGNKELGDTMNRFLNENSADVLNELKPTLEGVWGKIFDSVIGRLFDKVPFEDLSLP